MKTNLMCRVCGAELTNENWFPSYQKINRYICKSCHNKECKQWRMVSPEKAKAIWTRNHRKQGQQPMSKNKECSYYLGVYIAEQVLSIAFKHVERMPILNPGYDFICSGGYEIDAKSSCMRKDGRWSFNINHNIIADYFLCLAFDNREDLNPLHIWLIPGKELNHLKGATISPSTIHKWDEYRLDITKVTACCNVMKT